ncbi:hypothetical protein GCM10007908_27080 [Rhizobium albus]|nr:hypothetical protein GCM10007908_27080 [Rhizobium albus]
MDRRSFLGFLSVSLLASGGIREAVASSSKEPLTICVSLDAQRLVVFSGLDEIASSPISSGKAGHTTPTGIFSILDKRTFHRSNIYSNAPMPHMQRLTWSGIALHASNHVPGYAASHGCVRMPNDFARDLFAMTQLQAHVVITRESIRPKSIRHRTLPDALTPYDRLMAGNLELRLDTLDPHAEGVEVASAGQMTATVTDAGSAETPRSPLRLFLTRRTHRELTRDAQQLLNTLGFDAGATDGFAGPRTADALRRFQKEAGLTPTGYLAKADIAALYEAAGKGDVPAGHLYARRDFVPIFDMPVHLKSPERPLGAHLVTVSAITAGRATWNGLSLSDRPAPSVAGLTALEPDAAPTAAQVDLASTLGRLQLTPAISDRLSRELTVGSSLAISDNGLGTETGKGTDFIVLTRRG